MNKDKCRCECREKLSDKQRCDKGFIWNPSNCNCECDKSCVRGEKNYKNCKCRRKIISKLVKGCSKNIDQNEMIYNETLNVSLSDYKCNACTLHIVLLVVFLVTSIAIALFLFIFIGIQKGILQIFTTNINEKSQTF